jgi:hypothetical protein
MNLSVDIINQRENDIFRNYYKKQFFIKAQCMYRPAALAVPSIQRYVASIIVHSELPQLIIALLWLPITGVLGCRAQFIADPGERKEP